MARSAKIYKRNTQQKRTKKSAEAIPPRIIQIESINEIAQKIAFNHRVNQGIREDLLDRL